MLGLGHDGENDDLRRRDTGRQDKTVVIGMRHQERADEPGADAPARRPGELAFAFATFKFDPGGF